MSIYYNDPKNSRFYKTIKYYCEKGYVDEIKKIKIPWYFDFEKFYFLAAEKGYLELLKHFDEKYDISNKRHDRINKYRDRNGENIYTIAVNSDKPEVLEYLERKNFDIYHLATKGGSALLFAAENGKFKSLKHILKKIPQYKDGEPAKNIYLKDTDGDDIYLMASTPEMSEFIEKEYNWDVNIKNSYGCNKYLVACSSRSGGLEMVKYLDKKFKSGEHRECRDCYGQDALIVAIEYDNFDIAKYLISEFDWDLETLQYDSKYSVLAGTIESYKENEEMMEFLHEHDVNDVFFNKKKFGSESPFERSIRHGKLFYLKNYVKYYNRWKDNKKVKFSIWTLFLYALKHGSGKVINYIFEHPYLSSLLKRNSIKRIKRTLYYLTEKVITSYSRDLFENILNFFKDEIEKKEIRYEIEELYIFTIQAGSYARHSRKYLEEKFNLSFETIQDDKLKKSFFANACYGGEYNIVINTHESIIKEELNIVDYIYESTGYKMEGLNYPYSCACAGGNMEIIKYLEENFNIDPLEFVDSPVSNPMILAIENEQFGVVKYLRERHEWPILQKFTYYGKKSDIMQISFDNHSYNIHKYLSECVIEDVFPVKSEKKEIPEKMCMICVGKYKENEEVCVCEKNHYIHKQCYIEFLKSMIDEQTYEVRKIICVYCKNSMEENAFVYKPE